VLGGVGRVGLLLGHPMVTDASSFLGALRSGWGPAAVGGPLPPESVVVQSESSHLTIAMEAGKPASLKATPPQPNRP
jgi:hypothetical protein